eukprot:SAG31_NODE_1543_length_7944_cov_8.711281_8_plen_208_part_00
MPVYIARCAQGFRAWRRLEAAGRGCVATLVAARSLRPTTPRTRLQTEQWSGPHSSQSTKMGMAGFAGRGRGGNSAAGDASGRDGDGSGSGGRLWRQDHRDRASRRCERGVRGDRGRVGPCDGRVSKGLQSGVALTGQCPHMFSPSTVCAPANVSSLADCCMMAGPGIPCVGSSCPQSGWTFVPDDPEAPGRAGEPDGRCPGKCTSVR